MIPCDKKRLQPLKRIVPIKHIVFFLFVLIFTHVKAEAPLVGSNFWAWCGYGKAEDPAGDAVWEPGDDFAGDPPQEPQGLYSAFISDQTTLNIISEHAEKMNVYK